jgi:hypothetical protein
MNTLRKQILIAAALVCALAFTTTVAQAEPSRFAELADATFTENRPTKNSAQMLRDELLFQRATRLYGPTEAAMGKSWKPGDFEKVK